MRITGASLISVNNTSEFFGEETARYRNVKTIEVEGFILQDNKKIFHDIESVSGVVSGKVNKIIEAVNNFESITERIYINNVDYGSGKITSLSFPNSVDSKESDIFVGSFGISLEFYSQGDTTAVNAAFDSVTIPSIDLLQNFSESFEASLDEDKTYNFNHSIDINYASGYSTVDGAVIDPVANAKTLANNIYNQTLSSFNMLVPDSYGNYNSAAKSRFTEFYSQISHDCNFSRSFKLYQSGDPSNLYSAKIIHSFEQDDIGILSVTEQAEIEGRANDVNQMVDNCKSAINTELAKSYNRCSTVYDAYKSILVDGTYGQSLINTKLNLEKSLDFGGGTASYSVKYSDDLGVSSAEQITERTISVDKKEGIIQVSEEASISLQNQKGVLSVADYIAKIPSSASAKTRCQNVYTKNGYGGTLKSESKSFNLNGLKNASQKKMGKSLSYTYSFTDDPEVFDAGTFAKKQVSVNDTMPIQNKTTFKQPNIGEQVQMGHNTSLASRNVSIQALIRRTAGMDTINSKSNFKTTVLSAKTELFNEALTKGFQIFQDNKNLKPLDSNEIFPESVTYDFNSNRELNLKGKFSFPCTRFDGDSNYNRLSI